MASILFMVELILVTSHAPRRPFSRECQAAFAERAATFRVADGYLRVRGADVSGLVEAQGRAVSPSKRVKAKRLLVAARAERRAGCSPDLPPVVGAVPTLCAACVPTQPNWAKLRHAQCENDREKLVTQRASAALSEPE